jgi:hypothetical protein
LVAGDLAHLTAKTNKSHQTGRSDGIWWAQMLQGTLPRQGDAGGRPADGVLVITTS